MATTVVDAPRKAMGSKHIYWLVVFRPTPLKNDGVKVSWDDEIPNMMRNIIQIFQTTNQILWFSYGFPIVFQWFSYGFLCSKPPTGLYLQCLCNSFNLLVVPWVANLISPSECNHETVQWNEGSSETLISLTDIQYLDGPWVSGKLVSKWILSLGYKG